MSMTLPFVACVTCQQVIQDNEITARTIRLCQHCATVPWYHDACLHGAANCPTCAQPLTVADEWSPRQPAPDRSAWAGEDQGHQQVAASWDSIVARPTTNDAWWTALYTFLQNPPAAGEWEYLGFQHGAHEIRWHGESAAVFGPGAVDVHFHVHFTGHVYDGQPEWTYGSAWITGVHHMSVNIQENAALHNTVLPVLTHHWASITMSEAALRAAEDGKTWR